METIDKVKDLSITKEIKTSFLDYAMSVIVSRALPDSRDGLKPVHRRILYSMNDLGMHSDKAYKKSARIVGDVLGKYHPHGDSSVYGAMVRLAQEFATRYPLVDGHGNFGSIDGDGAAAMRYTEARMSKIAMELVRDINKDTIDFIDNYDGSEKEPSVLPSKFPNLIVNGTTGIAVGMATNIPPHNLGEVIDGVIAIMENSEITNLELMDYIDGPDFPTGAAILGRSGFKRAYETGKGSVTVRSKTEIITNKGREAIIVTEIPYQVNKAKVVEKIGELVRDKKIEGISALRDESNRLGIRVVIEVKREANANVILNNLYKQTSLQVNFSINLLSLVNGEPKLMDLKTTLQEYIKHQIIVMKRRCEFELKKAKDRAHILEGLKIALDNIDAIISIIRSSKNDVEACEKMISGYSLSEIQAKAILEMRLRRLTSLEGQKIIDELNVLYAEINRLNEILNSEELIRNAIKEELLEIKNRYNDKRRTIIDTTSIDVIEDEALIPVEDIVITLTKSGYIKRLNSDTYKAQNRGGRGVKGMSTNDEDQVDRLIFGSTHQNILFFTNLGKVYRIKGYSIPEFGRSAKGLPIVNLIQIDKGEFVKAIIPVNEDATSSLFFVTKKGIIKKTAISEFANIRANGKIALGLKEEDEVLEVAQINETDEILIASDAGKLIRFTSESIRILGRSASGVRGMRINENEVIIGMAVSNSLEDEVLILTESGFGKRTNVQEYRLQTRGGKGVKTVNITEKNGKLVGLLNVSSEEYDILVITTEGIIIRIPVAQVSQTGRSTQGVRIIKVREGEKVANVALIAADVSRETSADETLELTQTEE